MEASQKLLNSRLVVPWNPEKKIKKPRTPRLSSLHLRPLPLTTIINSSKRKLKDCIQENSNCYRQAGSTGLHTHMIDKNTMRHFCGMPTKENRICWCPSTPCHFCGGLPDVVPTQLLGKHVWE